MPVNPINSLEEFQAIVNSGKPVVIDFWADWCAPCKAISPIFENLSEGDSALQFYKVNVEDQPGISEVVGVRALPTFVFFNGGNKVEELLGANPQGLQDLVRRGVSLA